MMHPLAWGLDTLLHRGAQATLHRGMTHKTAEPSRCRSLTTEELWAALVQRSMFVLAPRCAWYSGAAMHCWFISWFNHVVRHIVQVRFHAMRTR